MYLREKMRAKFLITYGDEFTEKPNSLNDFLVIGKISDQLSHPTFFKEYDPKAIICLDGPLPYLLASRPSISRKNEMASPCAPHPKQ